MGIRRRLLPAAYVVLLGIARVESVTYPKSHASPVVPSSSSTALIAKSAASDVVITAGRRFGYMDGFGKTGIVEIPDDGIGDLLPKQNNTHTANHHRLATFLTISLAGIVLSRPLWTTNRIAFWHAVVITTILYLVEAICCSTRRFLSNMKTPAEVIDLLDDVRKQIPKLCWDIECYHYHYHTTSYEDKDGKRRTQTSRTKMVTHRASQEYLYNACLDRTPIENLLESLDYDPLTQSPFLQITLGKLLLFHDLQCYKDYLSQQAVFQMANGNRDQYCNTGTNFQVGEKFLNKLLAIRTVIGVQPHMRLLSFALCTLCGLTVPYRIWFDQNCDAINVLAVKEVAS